MLAEAPPRTLQDAIPTGDPAALLRLRRWGGTVLVQELVQLFETITPGRLETIRRALSAGDSPAAEAAAHSLGSSSGQVGALRMQRLCMQMEALTAGGRVGDALPLLPQVEEEYRRCQRWLAQEAMTMERAA